MGFFIDIYWDLQILISKFVKNFKLVFMNKIDYKEKLEDLVNDINIIAEDSICKFRGKFEIETDVHLQVGDRGYINTICTKIIYKDLSDLPILYIETYDEGTPVQIKWEKYEVSNSKLEDHYRQVYSSFLHYLLFAVDTRNLEDSMENPVVIIPIGTLLREGFKRD